MAEGQPQTLSSTIAELPLGRVRIQATKLSHRIQRVEEWINTAASHCKVTVSVPNPRSGTILHLRTHRESDRWVLQYKEDSPDIATAVSDLVAAALHRAAAEVSWKPLKAAPVRTKISAIALLPNLIQAMLEETTRLETDLSSAHSSLDVIEQWLGIGKEGSK